MSEPNEMWDVELLAQEMMRRYMRMFRDMERGSIERLAPWAENVLLDTSRYSTINDLITESGAVPPKDVS